MTVIYSNATSIAYSAYIDASQPLAIRARRRSSADINYLISPMTEVDFEDVNPFAASGPISVTPQASYPQALSSPTLRGSSSQRPPIPKTRAVSQTFHLSMSTETTDTQSEAPPVPQTTAKQTKEQPKEPNEGMDGISIELIFATCCLSGICFAATVSLICVICCNSKNKLDKRSINQEKDFFSKLFTSPSTPKLLPQTTQNPQDITPTTLTNNGQTPFTPNPQHLLHQLQNMQILLQQQLARTASGPQPYPMNVNLPPMHSASIGPPQIMTQNIMTAQMPTDSVNEPVRISMSSPWDARIQHQLAPIPDYENNNTLNQDVPVVDVNQLNEFLEYQRRISLQQQHLSPAHLPGPVINCMLLIYYLRIVSMFDCAYFRQCIYGLSV